MEDPGGIDPMVTARADNPNTSETPDVQLPTMRLSSKSVDDFDDMVYVSDDDENNPKAISTPPSSSVEPGMIPDIKALYLEKDHQTGRPTVIDQPPEDLRKPEESEETGRYALVIRYARCYGGRKNLSISSIVVQSPLLKKVVAWVLKDYPCMAPELDRLEVVAPFRPFVYRWERLVDALQSEQHAETKSHIQLFYDALKKELELTLEARDDFISHKTITFNSLWMIFSPGDTVLATRNKRLTAARLINGMIHSDRYEDVYGLDCQMIHCDGTSFGVGEHLLEIPEFDGMRKIDSLPCYPLRFHRNVDKVTQELIRNGKAYEQLAGIHHKQYQGIALEGHRPYYVDSRIIIDAETWGCHNASRQMWLKPMHNLKGLTASDDERLEQSEISDDDDNTYTTPSRKSKKACPTPALTDEQLMICGNTVKGYSLRNKRWVDFFVDNIQDVDWMEDAWDNVVLGEEQKDLIFSMVEGHRLKHRGLPTEGLNVLVGGPSGVGKTMAVKSLAESLHAPLVEITPADIDLDPEDPDLESPFTDLLEMCGKWNAIVLHDEGNESLYGNRRDRDGSEHMGASSIFKKSSADDRCAVLLRALESHSTALFVTMNGVMDPNADQRLLNRFHMTLNLPCLNTKTREAIWRKCLVSHKDINSAVDLKTLAEWPLNGREISNAVTAAKTLVRNGTLEMQHLERVVPLDKKDTILPPPPPPPAATWGGFGAADNVDPWASWAAGSKKKSKKDKKAAAKVLEGPPIEELPPVPNVDKEWEDWARSPRDKKPKDAAIVLNSSVAEVPEDSLAEEEIQPIPEAPEWWGFGEKKKSKKEKKAGAKVPAVEACPPEPDSDDIWGVWGFSRKDKKPVKAAAVLGQTVTLPAESLVEEKCQPLPCPDDDGWGAFGCKKYKKDRKVKPRKAQAFVPTEASPPIEAPALAPAPAPALEE
ncbi:MAG: hypothetical protein Q9169_006760 [Polycauliona sp. 2 TL-2023]